jgi:hypothetical protein
MWLEQQRKREQISDDEADVFSRFVTLHRWSKLVDVTFVMRVDADIAMQRENKANILPHRGSIMSTEGLRELNEALAEARRRYEEHFKLVDAPAQRGDVVEDNCALVDDLLTRFRGWADPKVLAVPREALARLLGQDATGVTLLQNGEGERALENLLADARCDERSKLEGDRDRVQLVASALPRDASARFFLLKRGEGDQKKKEHGRYTLWKGCHLAADGPPPDVPDLLNRARQQLCDRLLTDFHLASSLDPRFRALAWSPADNHAGLLFDVRLASDAVVRNMQEKEFRQQGRAEMLSGRFQTRDELRAQGEIEPWSKAFLEKVTDDA